VSEDGEVIAEGYWADRQNEYGSLTSMLVANTVTGAASLLRRGLLDYALPFPPAPGAPYHDHWIALCALATGDIVYVDDPLLDYVQHPAAVLGSEAIAAGAAPGVAARLRRLARDPAAALERWRDAYLDEYCRIMLFATVLELRCRPLLTPAKRRALSRILAGERSPLSLAWLAARPLRGLAGRNETMRFEHRLLRGIAWRHLAPRLSRRRRSAAG